MQVPLSSDAVLMNRPQALNTPNRESVRNEALGGPLCRNDTGKGVCAHQPLSLVPDSDQVRVTRRGNGVDQKNKIPGRSPDGGGKAL